MRHDISPLLVHFRRASEAGPPYDVLRRILSEKRLLAINRFVRWRSRCVCFSEAPLGALEHGLINSTGFTRYSPFGLQFSKEWIFSLGGHPVIYEPDHDFAQLPEILQWRHVRLELGASTVDFTWEREWRLPCEELRFSEQDVTVVLSDDEARDKFVHDIEHDAFCDAWAYTVLLGDLAWAYDRGNPWRTVTLKSVEQICPANGSQPFRSEIN
ncbi:MAG: hypothetical protein ACYDH9_25770 [Limisphaerales bacterium]